jgi:hypothetical protein
MKLLIMQYSQLSCYLVPKMDKVTRTSSLCTSFDVRDRVLQPCKTTGKIICLYVVTFIFLDSKLGLSNLILILSQTLHSTQTFIKALE